jgi:integrase/recombinase XerD
VSRLDHAAPTGTVEHAGRFATARPGVSARHHALRLSAIRCFARWAHSLHPDMQIPPAKLLPARVTRAAPSLYTGAEIAALLEAADELRPANRGATFHTLVALMSASGSASEKPGVGPDLLRRPGGDGCLAGAHV